MSKGYDCELLPNEPILLTTFYEGFTIERDAPALIKQMQMVFDEASEPIYMLDDTLHLKLSFSDLVAALAMSTRGETGVLRHPNMRKLVVISRSEIIRLGSIALKQAQYGVSSVDVYASLDEALEGIRRELAAVRVSTAA